ncbi:hypothetical protein [Aquabacterium sp.]|uniref:hypothetical protein n=1 Tax=Aquabacterium sp. TaxID=1872578 RepID=UPI0025BEFF08|nr:hypothetical protein [Aquabacterium sp.]
MCVDRVSVSVRRGLLVSLLSVGMALPAAPALAHNDGLSEASALSALPVAVSVSAPILSVAAGSVLVLASIEVVADGTVWVLQRASDGARIVVKWSAMSVGMASVAVGAAITVTAISAGWVLSTAGTVLALIPNALGQALLHHERVIR